MLRDFYEIHGHVGKECNHHTNAHTHTDRYREFLTIRWHYMMLIGDVGIVQHMGGSGNAGVVGARITVRHNVRGYIGRCTGTCVTT